MMNALRVSENRESRSRWGFAALALLLVVAHYGCTANSDAPAPDVQPPPEVAVISVTLGPVTLFDDYVGQTEAVDTVEIRSRVQGLLERQTFKDGAKVRKGDVLFVIDQQPYITALAQAKANLAQAEAALTNSQQNLSRAKRLIAARVLSQQDYDATVAKERTDAANVEAAQAAVREAQLNLGYTTIVAPQDGVLSKALVKPGTLITVAQTLMATLYSSHPMYVNFAVSEEKALKLTRMLKEKTAKGKEGAPSFRIKLVDGSEYPYPGHLDFVDAAVDSKTGTLQLRIAVPNPAGLLRPGQFARVVVPASENAQAIRVPQQAVQELQGIKSVYVVGADGKAASRQVTANHRVGTDWVVEKGLQPGDAVVVEGTQKVRPGAPVKAVFVTADGLAAERPGGFAGPDRSPPNPAKAGG
jgi:membrane fusion protein (multidrug efflux system)